MKTCVQCHKDKREDEFEVFNNICIRCYYGHPEDSQRRVERHVINPGITAPTRDFYYIDKTGLIRKNGEVL